MATDRTPALLVKSAGNLRSGQLGFGAVSVKVRAEPLFQHIPADSDGQLGLAGAEASWQRLTLEDGADQNVWDLCHALTRPGMGLAGGQALFAEPDLWQRWNHPMVEGGLGAAATCGPARQQRTDFPCFPGDNYWFRGADHSGFGVMPGGADGAGARIAHFDTGIDPDHATLPPHMRLDLARNFVDAGRLTDATDRSDGLLVQDGHGTGTLGILASQAYGGAPGAEVVPIRIADRVVLFRNSALAKAFDYVYGLRNTPTAAIDVITMSMGGIASQAWADAINRLYEAGVFMVTAAGNNQNNLPTRGIVFPARFQRVTAACGVMFDGQAYADLGAGRMAGNYGPQGKMRTALAAFTPNVPWAVRGCGGLIDFSGQGTSCATPQIAAAAAVWIAHNRAALNAYPKPWMKVEAVRRALAQAARTEKLDLSKLGAGALRADAALGIAPPAAASLKQEAKDKADFPILRILTGQGIAAGAHGAMLELEALQLSQSAEIEGHLPDTDAPETALSPAQRRRISQALADQPGASAALKQALGVSTSPRPAAASLPKGETAEAMTRMHLENALAPPVQPPPSRRLRVYAFDPSLSTSQDTAAINVARLDVRWEDGLQPGPVGEYLEVVDIDPASDRAYAPVDLNHPRLLSQDGLAPHPGDPRFHQQMVYAVAMTTIGHFERALGRTALWSSRPPGKGRSETFIRRLRIYPHAFRGQNAYYTAERKALLFGYFPSVGADWRDQASGQLVFTCMSHDIIAHETTHALLDGIHPRYREATNPDVLALHEAFADLVALFQHFTLPEAVAHQIAATRGDLTRDNPLVKLAAEFGRATSRGGEFQTALRAAVDDETRASLNGLRGDAAVLPIEVHDRGARLMAAVFDAFLKIYQQRSDEVILLATGGSGILPQGRLSQPVVQALAREASKTAGHFMGICIRALDYCPPVDVEFSDYLRAMITADRDLVPDDPRGYRLALIAGFTKRGIFPRGVGALSPGSLVWEPPPIPITSASAVIKTMNLGWDRRSDREVAWTLSRDNARILHAWLSGKRWVKGKLLDDPKAATEAELSALGLYRKKGRYEVAHEREVTDRDGKTTRVPTTPIEVSPIEVHSVRPARRVSPDGTVGADLVVEITQSWVGPDGQKRRGGCTVLFDLETHEARYLIRKRVGNLARIEAEKRNRQAAAPGQTLWDSYFGGGETNEPFAALHRH